jgi:hypothetical protein
LASVWDGSQQFSVQTKDTQLVDLRLPYSIPPLCLKAAATIDTTAEQDRFARLWAIGQAEVGEGLDSLQADGGEDFSVGHCALFQSIGKKARA